MVRSRGQLPPQPNSVTRVSQPVARSTSNTEMVSTPRLATKIRLSSAKIPDGWTDRLPSPRWRPSGCARTPSRYVARTTTPPLSSQATVTNSSTRTRWRGPDPAGSSTGIGCSDAERPLGRDRTRTRWITSEPRSQTRSSSPSTTTWCAWADSCRSGPGPEPGELEQVDPLRQAAVLLDGETGDRPGAVVGDEDEPAVVAERDVAGAVAAGGHGRDEAQVALPVDLADC